VGGGDGLARGKLGRVFDRINKIYRIGRQGRSQMKFGNERGETEVFGKGNESELAL